MLQDECVATYKAPIDTVPVQELKISQFFIPTEFTKTHKLITKTDKR